MKCLIFDFDNTLIYSKDGFKLAEKFAQQKLVNSLEKQYDDFIIDYRFIRSSMVQKLNHRRLDWWNTLYKFYNIDKPSIDLVKLEDEYWNIVEKNSSIFDESIKVLSDIKTIYPEVKLGLISDTDGQPKRKLKRFGLYPEIVSFFDLKIVSGEGKFPPKPKSPAFKYILKKLQVKKTETGMIGDNYLTDIKGALKVGLKPFWFKHPKLYPNDDEQEINKKVTIIRSLQEILFWLEKL